MGGRLYGLDALRGIAALLVAWHHFQQVFFLPAIPLAPFSAVDLFLAISGFIMARTYEHRMLRPSKFLAIRYRRLWPVMAIGTSIGTVVYLFQIGPSSALVPAFIATLLFLPAPPFLLNTPVWSLFCEVVANWLHAAIFARSGNLFLASLAGLCATVVGVATITTGVVFWGSDYLSLGLATLRCLSCYILGILVFRIYGEKPLGKPVVAILAVPALLVAGGFLPALFSVTFAVIAAPLLVRCSLGFPPSRLASALGGLSFPLYAVHVPAFGVAILLGWGPFAGAVLALTLAVCASRLCQPANDAVRVRDNAGAGEVVLHGPAGEAPGIPH